MKLQGAPSPYRSLILHHYKQGMTPKQIVDKINQRYRNDPKHVLVTVNSVYGILTRHRNGNTNKRYSR